MGSVSQFCIHFSAPTIGELSKLDESTIMPYTRCGFGFSILIQFSRRLGRVDFKRKVFKIKKKTVSSDTVFFF